MITITVNNSYSKIEGLTAPQEKELRKLLSYVVGGQSAHFSSFGPKRISLLSKKGEFPTGLVKHVLEFTKYATFKDNRVAPKNTQNHHYLPENLYPAQKIAVTRALSRHRGTIVMPTGSGKSKVIEEIARALNVKTLVVVPNLGIKQQLQSTLKHLKNVTVENVDSKAIKNDKSFDCVIIDEAHHVAAKTYQKLNKEAWQGTYFRYFLTATGFRNDPEETLLFESLAGEVIYNLTYHEAVAHKYIVPIEAYYIEISKKSTNSTTWAKVYNELVVNNELRNNTIAELLLKLKDAEKSTLCLVKEIAHGDNLSMITGIPFVNGQDDDSRDYIRQFNNGEQTALIGTTGVIGEGIDTKPCEYVIIAGLGKAKSAFQQQVGRAVRNFSDKETAKIIIIKDSSHKFTLRHFQMQCKILIDEYGVKPTKLEV